MRAVKIADKGGGIILLIGLIAVPQFSFALSTGKLKHVFTIKHNFQTDVELSLLSAYQNIYYRLANFGKIKINGGVGLGASRELFAVVRTKIMPLVVVGLEVELFKNNFILKAEYNQLITNKFSYIKRIPGDENKEVTVRRKNYGYFNGSFLLRWVL